MTTHSKTLLDDLEERLLKALDRRDSPAWQAAWWRWRALLALAEAAEREGA